MARINRSSVIQKAVNDLGISTSNEKIPNETLDKVQLTYGLNPHFSSFIARDARATTGTGTVSLPTISAGSDIYITSIDYSVVKDATCDVATSTLLANITPDASGIATSIASINVITLTAQSERCHIDFAYPLKIKANTSLTYAATFSAGIMLRAVTITGFVTSSN